MKQQTSIGMRAYMLLTSLLLGLFCTSYAWAQTSANYVTVPYSMSFEKTGPDSVELATNLWHLNTGAMASACEDYWTIGTATRSDGKRSAYIVHDDSTMFPGYGHSADLQFMYRDFEFSQGTYSSYYVSFDWLNSCKSDSGALYVGYVTYQTGTTPGSRSAAAQIAANSGSGVFPSSLLGANCSGALYNAVNWQNYTFPTPLVASANMTYRFYVAWANKGHVSGNGYAACFDNLQIISTACPRPENFIVTDDYYGNVQMAWTGASTDYEVQYRPVGTDVWNTCDKVTVYGNNGTGKCTNLNEGSYDFRVRGICSPDVSAWVNYANYFVYREDLHCINFTDLNGPNVTCYSGTTRESYATSKSAAYSTRGVIDFGSDDIRSRHTVNTDPTATDPRTGGNLPLIPKGQKFSVRLGNWDTGNGAEAISYTYTLDSANAIVLLQYAVVLEEPSHVANEQSRFVLEVLDKWGNLLDNTCGMRNYTPQMDWQVVGSGYGGVAFKPWTTFGLNVSELGVQDGEQVSIRLTTYDCFSGGHYGYAYFTLDCAKAAIDVVPYPVGEDSTSVELIAPAGFEYQWFDSRHAPIVGATSARYVPTYLGTHYCRLTSMDNSDCYFELETQCSLEDPTPDEPQNIVETHHDPMATKVLLDGRVYIDRYGVLYDMMGHPVY